MYLSGHGALKSGGAEGLAVLSGIEVVDIDSLRMLLTTLLTGLSFLSEGVAGVGDDMAAALKSKAVPGVLGAFPADPKEANAPEPSPNAEEPPVVGDAKPPGVKGDIALKGFRPPWEESPPKRLVAETVRWCGSDFSLLFSECDMERESLLVLLAAVSGENKDAGTQEHTWSAESRDYPCYPLAAVSNEYIIQCKKVKYPRLGGSNERTSSGGAGGLAANVRRRYAGCSLWWWMFAARRKSVTCRWYDAAERCGEGGGV